MQAHAALTTCICDFKHVEVPQSVKITCELGSLCAGGGQTCKVRKEHNAADA